MNKYKTFLVLLGIFCAVLVGVSFMIGGSPVSQQAVSLDQIRLSNFNEIKFTVDEYYRENATVPQSLEELEQVQKSVKMSMIDPESKTPYTYQQTSPTSFDLCTTFSTNSSENDEIRYMYPENDNNHSKGYDCISYTVSPYLLTPSPGQIAPQPLQSK